MPHAVFLGSRERHKPRDVALAAARSQYVSGTIDVEVFERRVARALRLPEFQTVAERWATGVNDGALAKALNYTTRPPEPDAR